MKLIINPVQCNSDLFSIRMRTEIFISSALHIQIQRYLTHLHSKCQPHLNTSSVANLIVVTPFKMCI